MEKQAKSSNIGVIVDKSKATKTWESEVAVSSTIEGIVEDIHKNYNITDSYRELIKSRIQYLVTQKINETLLAVKYSL